MSKDIVSELTEGCAEATFQTAVVEIVSGHFHAIFSFEGIQYLAGVYSTAAEAHVQVLLAVQRHLRS
jgi:hypothetical protein